MGYREERGTADGKHEKAAIGGRTRLGGKGNPTKGDQLGETRGGKGVSWLEHRLRQNPEQRRKVDAAPKLMGYIMTRLEESHADREQNSVERSREKRWSCKRATKEEGRQRVIAQYQEGNLW